MTNRQIKAGRIARQFMPRLFDFAYPANGRGFARARRAAFKAWVFAFRCRVALLD